MILLTQLSNIIWSLETGPDEHLLLPSWSRQDMFAELDEDGSGELTMEEIATCLFLGPGLKRLEKMECLLSSYILICLDLLMMISYDFIWFPFQILLLGITATYSPIRTSSWILWVRGLEHGNLHLSICITWYHTCNIKDMYIALYCDILYIINYWV